MYLLNVFERDTVASTAGVIKENAAFRDFNLEAHAPVPPIREPRLPEIAVLVGKRENHLNERGDTASFGLAIKKTGNHGKDQSDLPFHPVDLVRTIQDLLYIKHASHKNLLLHPGPYRV